MKKDEITIEKISFERELACSLSEITQNALSEHYGDDFNSLDGDQTEELSVMFREELDKLNGNL